MPCASTIVKTAPISTHAFMLIHRKSYKTEIVQDERKKGYSFNPSRQVHQRWLLPGTNHIKCSYHMVGVFAGTLRRENGKVWSCVALGAMEIMDTLRDTLAKTNVLGTACTLCDKKDTSLPQGELLIQYQRGLFHSLSVLQQVVSPNHLDRTEVKKTRWW